MADSKSDPRSGDVPIGDWLGQDPSDAGEVAARYDAWAHDYDTDLASWS
jgi:hypothetical protein